MPYLGASAEQSYRWAPGTTDISQEFSFDSSDVPAGSDSVAIIFRYRSRYPTGEPPTITGFPTGGDWDLAPVAQGATFTGPTAVVFQYAFGPPSELPASFTFEVSEAVTVSTVASAVMLGFSATNASAAVDVSPTGWASYDSITSPGNPTTPQTEPFLIFEPTYQVQFVVGLVDNGWEDPEVDPPGQQPAPIVDTANGWTQRYASTGGPTLWVGDWVIPAPLDDSPPEIGGPFPVETERSHAAIDHGTTARWATRVVQFGEYTEVEPPPRRRGPRLGLYAIR